ncbi:MAG: sulfatase-like hydrolase/transferase, partial [Chitinivibrionales bacterium]|nr:sulfatase-like hydrolase/transferase [Chitinivibrionales bacterium]
SKPFFLFVSFHSPHEPLGTPPEYEAQYDTGDEKKNIYYGNVSHLDTSIGRFLGHIDQANLRDSSFVMYTSDNGPDLNRWVVHPYGSSGDLSCYKLTLYEGGIRVPGIVRWPGHTQAGTVSNEPISGCDMLPTFCAMSGAAVPSDRWIDGDNVVPVIEGGHISRHQPLFWSYVESMGCPDHPEDHDGDKPYIAIRDGDFKLCTNKRYGHIKFYNLAEDPQETTNLAEQMPQRVNEMLATLQAISEDVEAEGALREPLIRQVHTSLVRNPGMRRQNENHVKIFSLAGKRTAHFVTREKTVALQKLNLPRGYYIAKVNNGNSNLVASPGRLVIH